MSIALPNLPYAEDALEPYISQRTVNIHYTKHHKKYVDTLNKLILGTAYEALDLEEIVLRSFQKNTKIFNNAGQAWNHNFFWNCLDKNKTPSRAFTRMLEQKFNGIDGLKRTFNSKGAELFGSGWVWLVKDARGELSIRKTKNAKNPLIMGEAPLLTCDVWEHAYYLDYQNERPKFLENFWNIVNWDFVERNLERDLPIQPSLSTAEEFERARASHH
jgi:Fe-Mn family superoxide dismutase